jgi:hypothetical protein
MLTETFASIAGACLAYVCGPPDMVRTAETGLDTIGVTAERLNTEEVPPSWLVLSANAKQCSRTGQRAQMALAQWICVKGPKTRFVYSERAGVRFRWNTRELLGDLGRASYSGAVRRYRSSGGALR